MKKAIVTAITQAIEVMMVSIIIITLVFLISSTPLQVDPILKQYSVERRAMSTANMLSAHPSIIYSDENGFHKGVLDKEKLDRIFTTKSEFLESWKSKLAPNIEFLSEVSYPGYSFVVIIDVENRGGWFALLSNPLFVEVSPSATTGFSSLPSLHSFVEAPPGEGARDVFLDCLKDNINEAELPSIFIAEPPVRTRLTGAAIIAPESPKVMYSILALEKCQAPFYSKVLAYGTPISIKYPDGALHAGLIRVEVVGR